MDELKPGRAWPLGASVRDGGVNVVVASEHASAVELCLFDDEGQQELRRLPLPGRSGDLWHGFLPGAGAGLVYGLRALGPWRPERGHRFNPHKLLLDPWAREIVGRFDWGPEHQGADPLQSQHPQTMDLRDNAATALKARVVDDRWDWTDDRRPDRALAETVLYEVHLRAFSRLLPGLPDELRGTYLGLASEPGIAHLQRLGVTAVSLLPVHQHLDEQRLVQLGLVNHWGYNTLGFFCPSPRYASRPEGRRARDEFRTMVQRLHAAGIEVLLDVVFNHTAESDERGPQISWRGLDNATWYRLPEHHRAAYENWSGCGNTLDLHQPRVLQFVLDSLRYWVGEMHVDGFRFDLAPVLARGAHAFERHGAFFKALQQDPLLAGVKLVAEPWDLGPHGYQLGHFPRGWLEWNDKFRDDLRRFWLGHGGSRGALARRLAGSADVFQGQGRSPLESVNYVVSHDGFTLRDLVSYNDRHNLANLEGNRDGHAHELSWNCGTEGASSDPAVLQRRARLQRALLACVLLAQGTPMLAAGAELGHGQRGNNNPYCQDNEITWLDWVAADADLLAYTAHLTALRRRLLPLGPRWYGGQPDARGRVDLGWALPSGQPLTEADWQGPGRALAAHIGAPGKGGAPLLLLINGDEDDCAFTLPAGRWTLELDSSQPQGQRPWQGDSVLTVAGRSVVLLRQ
ncbi:MAG: glycogen debranching protein GlgX [Rubrivivax sp.]